MTRIETPLSTCLWFDDRLEDAVAFWTGIFPRSSVGQVARLPDGSVLGAEWTLDGMPFRGINGGPDHHPFTEAVSISVTCADQDEVDRYWDALVDGGEESRCGWLRDRFGLSWQIVPQRLYDLLGDPDPARAQAVMHAMLTMSRIVVADLEAAADAVSPAAAPAGGQPG